MSESIGRRMWRGALGAATLLAVIGSGSWVLTAHRASRPDPRRPWVVEAALPAHCLAHVAFDGGAFGEGAPGLALAELGRDPQVRQFMAPIEATLRSRLDTWLGKGGMTLDQLAEIFGGRTTLTLVDLDLGAPGEDHVANAILTVELLRAELGVAARKAIDALMADGLGVAGRDVEIGGVRGREVDLEGTPLIFCIVGERLVAGTNRATLRGVIDRLQAKVETGGLSDHPEVVAARARVAGASAPVVSVWLDVDGAIDVFRPHYRAEVEPLVALLGAESWRGLGYSMTFEGSGIVDRALLAAKSPRRGILSGSTHRATASRLLREAPRDGLFFGELRLDLAAVLPALLEKLPAYDEYLHAEVADVLRAFTERHGCSLEKDVVATLSGEIAVWGVQSPRGGIIPEVVLALGVRDRIALDEILKGIARRAAVDEHVGTFRFLEQELAYVDTAPVFRGVEASGLAPKLAWWLDGDALLIASSPQTLKNLVAVRKEGRPALSENSDRVDALGELRGPEKAGGGDGMGYVDLRALSALVIDSAAPLLQSLEPAATFEDPFGGETVANPVDPLLIPTADVFRRHLSGAVLDLEYADDGVVWRMRSPVGLLATSAFAQAASMAVDAHLHPTPALGEFDLDELPPLDLGDPAPARRGGDRKR